MPRKAKSGGYLIPSPVSPYPLRCYCVQIPDAPEYRAAFIAQIYELTRFRTWRRGTYEDRTAVQLYLSEVLLPQIENDMACGCLKFRNKRDDPAQVQISCDDGVTWEDAFRLDAGQGGITKIINNIQVNVDAQIRLDILNRYDGSNNTTININCPSPNYEGDASDDRNAALCMACNGYVRKIVNDYHDRAIVALGLASLFTLIGTLVAPVILIPVGLLLIEATEVAIHACEDQQAVDNVVCCMVDGLTGQTVTRAHFQASLSSCGFGVGTNEALLRDIVAATFPDFGNWAVFIDGLGNAFIQAQAGVRDCPCGGDCATFPTGDWTALEGTIALDGLSVSSSAITGVVMQLDLVAPKTITSVTWVDSDTDSNIQSVYVDFYGSGVLIERQTFIEHYHNGPWVDFAEPTTMPNPYPKAITPVDNCDRVVILNTFDTQLGTFTGKDFKVCWQ